MVERDTRGGDGSRHQLCQSRRGATWWWAMMDFVDGGPRGAVTFLFTDLEGSTGLWEADAASMDAALRLHDELLVSTMERRGGRVFSRAGDSFAAAFGSPSDAVVAAVEVQRGI